MNIFKLLLAVMVIGFISNQLQAQEQVSASINELDAITLKSQNIIINNINVLVGDALMGGTKATAQCTGNNKNEEAMNYTVYIVAFDSSNNMIACFNLEPQMNVHEAGKIETLETSGMVSKNDKSKVDHFNIKLVVQ